ncbi:MAG: permease [Candidatus Hadarchaeaceae archaeon]
MSRGILAGILCVAAVLVSSWSVLGPLRGKLPLFLGDNPSVHVMMILTVFLCVYISAIKPQIARKSTGDSLKTIRGSIIYIIAALFIAGAVINLLPTEIVAEYLGEQAGFIAVLVGVAIGCVLPACPFITCPIIFSVFTLGAGLPGLLGMLFGSGTAYACVLA